MNKKYNYLVGFLLLIYIFCACKKPHQKEVSFYYWNTQFKLDSTEKKYLSQLQVNNLYVRFFDIVKENGKIKPNAIIQIDTTHISENIIPVIFIENEVFRNTDNVSIDDLVDHVTKQIDFICQHSKIKLSNEIQFDCDWTATTAKSYFYFLKKYKEKKQQNIVSATIRLHQIKDKSKTGIPNIDKGVLMYYSTGNPLDFDDKNSILDNKTAENYISNISDYPIPLDIALPIYSWAIVKNEFSETKLLGGVQKRELADTSFFGEIKKDFYVVKQSNYLKGIYLYEDQKIKLETIFPKDLLIATKNIKKNGYKHSNRVIFYNIDAVNLDNFSIEDLNKISKSL